MLNDKFFSPFWLLSKSSYKLQLQITRNISEPKLDLDFKLRSILDTHAVNLVGIKRSSHLVLRKYQLQTDTQHAQSINRDELKWTSRKHNLKDEYILNFHAYTVCTGYMYVTDTLILNAN